MKTQTQKQMASFLDISPQHLSDIKRKRRTLGKATALRISEKTGLSFQDIAFLDGEDFIKKIKVAMLVSDAEEER